MTRADKTFLQLKDGRTHYILEGEVHNSSAPLIVCVHGIGSGTYSYQSFAEYVVKVGGYRILRLDLYGRGSSDSVTNPHNGQLFIEQIYELLEKLNLIENIILVGHSMGGAIAALFTQKYPNLVQKLILLTPAGLPFKMPLGSYFLGVPYLGKWGFSLLNNWISTEKLVAENFFDIAYSKNSIDLLIKNRKETGMDKFVDAMVNSVNNFPLTGCIAEITEISKQDRPTLIVWAYYDTTVPPDECFSQWYNLFKDNPKASFAVIKDVRHNFFNEEKEICNKLLIAWINGDDHKVMELHNLRNKNSGNISLTKRDINLKEFWNSHEEFKHFMI
jgi:pimeloyl-ACP methyl ester carboxylesterase